MEPSHPPSLGEAPPEADASPSVESEPEVPAEPAVPVRIGALAPRALEGTVAGLVVETLLGLVLWAAFALGKQSFAPVALLYFAGHGALFGAALGLTAQTGARHKLLGTLVGLLGALSVFGATRFLQELIVLGNPLLAYGSLIKASGGFRWLDLGLYVLGAVACWGPVLLARWRGASGLKQAYAGLAGASAFGLGCLLSPLRFQAFSPAIYGIPLLGRVALFPLAWAGLDLWRRLRAARRAEAERREAAGGSAPRRAVVDPRARHKARYLEGKAAEHLAQERWLEAGEAFTSAADLWPSAKRHLSAASAFARAEEPYRALAHLERVIEDPSHDPSWLEAPELSYLRELEAWAPLAARLAAATPARRHASSRKAAPARLEGESSPPQGVPESAPVESPATESPAVESPAVESPAAESAPVESPAVESAAVESPATESPAVESPAVESPAVESPAAEPPAAEPPLAESPPAQSPPAQSPPAALESTAPVSIARELGAPEPANPEPGPESLPDPVSSDAAATPSQGSPPVEEPAAPPRQPSERVAPRRRKVARRRDAAPQEFDGSQGVLIAGLGLLMILGYLFSYSWTPDASLDSVRRLWAGRLSRNGGALYGLGRDLDRGARLTLAQLKAESGSLPGALLAFGFEPASGQCGISAEWAYRSAADAGDGRAMLRLAQILSRVNPPRPQAVTELLRRAAEAGEPRAMWLYASRLRAGTGVEADPAGARAWLERGAEAGHRDAQFLLASWLELGHADAIAQDLPASLRWYLRAAQQGHPRARSEAERLLRRYPELKESLADEG